LPAGVGVGGGRGRGEIVCRGLSLSEFELSVLEREDCLAECLTLLDIGNRLVQRDLKHGLALYGDN
jgi:hypothetical protein